MVFVCRRRVAFLVVDFTFSWFFGFQPLRRRSPHISVYNILVFVCLDFSTTEFPSSLLQRVFTWTHASKKGHHSKFHLFVYAIEFQNVCFSAQNFNTLECGIFDSTISILQDFSEHRPASQKTKKNTNLYWISSMFFLVWIIFENHSYPMMTPLRRRVSTSQHGGVNASGVYSAVRVRFAIYTVYESIHEC
jgi:hypothetical protein